MASAQDQQHTDSQSSGRLRVRRVLLVLAMIQIVEAAVNTLANIVTQMR